MFFDCLTFPDSIRTPQPECRIHLLFVTIPPFCPYKLPQLWRKNRKEREKKEEKGESRIIVEICFLKNHTHYKNNDNFSLSNNNNNSSLNNNNNNDNDSRSSLVLKEIVVVLVVAIESWSYPESVNWKQLPKV